jgi:septal ring factor EnvC (AmiA/AmiB activator)
MKIIEQSESLSSHVKLEHEIARLRKENKKAENKDVQAIEDQLKELKMKLLDKEALINQMNPKINKFKELEQKNKNLLEEVRSFIKIITCQYLILLD